MGTPEANLGTPDPSSTPSTTPTPTPQVGSGPSPSPTPTPDAPRPSKGAKKDDDDKNKKEDDLSAFQKIMAQNAPKKKDDEKKKDPRQEQLEELQQLVQKMQGAVNGIVGAIPKAMMNQVTSSTGWKDMMQGLDDGKNYLKNAVDGKIDDLKNTTVGKGVGAVVGLPGAVMDKFTSGLNSVASMIGKKLSGAFAPSNMSAPEDTQTPSSTQQQQASSVKDSGADDINPLSKATSPSSTQDDTPDLSSTTTPTPGGIPAA